jgi:AcrR family transcriptional regulator
LVVTVDNPGSAGRPGLREQKRRETLRRIAEAGMRLFTANGFEATTLDAIAAEAGISRRTFFHYFKSKDDILLSMQRVYDDALAAAVVAQGPGIPPLVAAREALVDLLSTVPPDQLLVTDRLMRSSAAVQASKQASYAQTEKVLLDALSRQSAEPESVLRLVAMLAIGVSRIAVDAWSKEGGQRPVAEVLREGFEALDRAHGAR